MNTISKSPLLSEKRIFIASFVLLVVLALLSWLISGVDFENFEANLKPFPIYLIHLNDILALGIAVVQAIIITVIFMNLKNTTPLGAIVFFISVFLAFTLVILSVFSVLPA